jgi:hypothetical protein
MGKKPNKPRKPKYPPPADEIELYGSKTDQLHIKIKAKIDNGRLSIFKRDSYGTREVTVYEYNNNQLSDTPSKNAVEYRYNFDKEDTERLFTLLTEDKKESDRKKILLDNFGGLDGYEKLVEYCDINDILYAHYIIEDVDLCEYHTRELSVNISARIVNGRRLSIFGHDFDEGEVEYWYDFDKDNTELLFMMLTEDSNESDRKKLLLDNFGGLRGCDKLVEYCKTNGLTYKYRTWFSHDY